MFPAETPIESLRAGILECGYEGGIHLDAGSRAVYSTDNSIYQVEPIGALSPTSTDDIATVLAINYQLSTPFELVARGGGTGTNGQSLTSGVVVDLRRGMNRILSVDVDAGEAVVEPGVVLGQLNAYLAPSGLFFAPHASTATRATIGGMVSTDAAGKGSLVFGRTNNHVLSIDAILDDGTPWTFTALDRDEAERLADKPGRVGDLHRRVLDALNGVQPDWFPDVPRGFTGYNLADAASALGDSCLDMTKLLCGSEGTLAMISSIRIKLSPLPAEPYLAVVMYPTFDQAVRDANRLKETQPMAIECLDERTISMATGSPAWPELAALLADEQGDTTQGSILLLEYEGDGGIGRLRKLLGNESTATHVAVTNDSVEIAAVWKVRADAVGLLGQAVGGRRSVAFVEDCAVPPAHLEEFVAGFRQILDRHELSYGMFGHADVGCVHVRPALDLYQPAHEELIRTISDEVAALVAQYGGVLWGEHGRGFRGEYLNLSEKAIDRMRQVKTAFDPRDLLNPGKLYRPYPETDDSDINQPAITKIDEVPLRIHRDRTVDEATRRQFETAFDCNGNGICHHWGEAEVMCPSFKATSDPRLSPKGRADLIRAWLARPDDRELQHDLGQSLKQCLSCAACTGRCPMHVDIPELKSRFLEQHPERGARSRIRHQMLSRFESLLPAAQAWAKLMGPLQRLATPAMRAVGIVDLPVVPPGSLDERMQSLAVRRLGLNDQPGDATVILLPDPFTALLEPAVLDATVRVLQALGERPAVGPYVPTGKYDHVKGRRRHFARAVAKQRAAVERLGRHGLDLVVIEPAVTLLHRHEYPAIDAGYPTEAIRSLPDFLAERAELIKQVANENASADSGIEKIEKPVVQLFNHCTDVSLAPQHPVQYRMILESAGFTVETESTTCCGMAGIFGHEAENQVMSVKLFEQGWLPRLDDHADRVDKAGPAKRCATGYSCRSQAKRLGAPQLQHPLMVLADALSAAQPI